MEANAKAPILAVDLGTTSCKAVLVASDQQVVATESRSYAMLSSCAGFAEQDPTQIERAASACVAAILKCSAVPPCAIVLSSAMHSLMAVDRDGLPLTRLITWADRRAESIALRLRRAGSADRLSRETGTPVHASSPLCKLIWLRENEPELFAQAARFVSMKEFLLWRWTGASDVDASTASASGLFDLASGAWHEEAMNLAAVTPERLSRIVPTTEVLTTWRPELVAQLGIPVSLPLVVGASDGALANLGVGATTEDVVAVSMGTSAAVRRTVANPRRAAAKMFCYVLDSDHWVTGGAINNVGLALAWVGSRFFGEEEAAVERLLELAATSPIGAAGVRCTARLAGERYPDYGAFDEASDGASFEGLRLEHERADLFRAAVEAVVWSVALLVRSMPDVREIRAGGGVLQSVFVRQMLADMTGMPVRMPSSLEVSGLGAVWLARRALGDEDAFARAAETALPVTTLPEAEAHRQYLAVHSRCRRPGSDPQ